MFAPEDMSISPLMSLNSREQQQNKTLPLKDGFLSRLSRRSISRAVVLGDEGPRTSEDLCKLKQDSFSRCMFFTTSAFSSVEHQQMEQNPNVPPACGKKLLLTLRKICCEGDSPFAALILIIGVTVLRAGGLEKENARTAVIASETEIHKFCCDCTRVSLSTFADSSLRLKVSSKLLKK